MAKHTPHKKKYQVADGGDFVTVALGLLDNSEAVQPSMFEVDYRKDQARLVRGIFDKKYPRRSVVYFVQEVSAEGYIKIGYSNQFEVRLIGIQVNNPRELKVLLLVDGKRILERQLQEQFWDWHVRGDWFLPSPELLAFIESKK